MNRAAAWLAPVVIGAASAGAYAYWRQRQARRSRMRRLSRAFASAGATVTPLLEAARTDKRLWGIAPLAAGAAAAYLRAARRGDGPEQRVMDAARAASSARWRDLDFRELLATAALPEMEAIESPPRWTLAIPVIGAGFVAAWFGAGAMRRRKSRRVRLGDIMTRNVQTVRPEASVFEASTLMQRLGVGFLPVCDGRRLHGVLTDRDVVVRSVAASRDAQLAIVRDAMSPEVVYAFEDDGVDRGAALMRKHQIRRLPIVDQQKNLVGVVSLGDLAVDTGRDRLAGATLERISEPARPTR